MTSEEAIERVKAIRESTKGIRIDILELLRASGDSALREALDALNIVDTRLCNFKHRQHLEG